MKLAASVEVSTAPIVAHQRSVVQRVDVVTVMDVQPAFVNVSVSTQVGSGLKVQSVPIVLHAKMKLVRVAQRLRDFVVAVDHALVSLHDATAKEKVKSSVRVSSGVLTAIQISIQIAARSLSLVLVAIQTRLNAPRWKRGSVQMVAFSVRVQVAHQISVKHHPR